MHSRFEKQRELESLITKAGGKEKIQNEYSSLTGKPVGLFLENPEGTNIGGMIKAIIDVHFPNGETA